MLERVALENLGNFKGDADVAEDLGISTTPESLERRIQSAQEAARVLSGHGAVAPVNISTAEPDYSRSNPKYGFDRLAWQGQPPVQQATNRAGIAAVREALEAPKEQ